MHENQYFKYLENEKRYSAYTIQSYHIDISQFVQFCSLSDTLFQVENTSHLHIREWIVSLIDKGYNTRSVNRKISALKSLFRFFQKNGIISENPAKKVISPKNSSVLPFFVDHKGMDQLETQSLFSDDFTGWRNQLIMELLYQTGIRRSELVHLKVQDVDFYGKTIRVLGKRNKERIIPVTDQLLELMKQYLVFRGQVIKESNSFLIITEKGKQIYGEMVYRVVKKYLSMVSSVEKRSPHVMRHTFATHMLNNGADLNAIKELLGHANLAATQVYTHNTFEKLKHIYKQAHPRA